MPDGKFLSIIMYGNNFMDMQVGCTLLPETDEIVLVSLRPDMLITDQSADRSALVLRGRSSRSWAWLPLRASCTRPTTQG